MEGVNYGNGGFPRSDREVVCGREYVGDGAGLGVLETWLLGPSEQRRRFSNFGDANVKARAACFLEMYRPAFQT